MADEVAGTYFAQAREYLPGIGRFTARDVIKGIMEEPQSLNEYIYCWNQPMDFVDSDGLRREKRNPKGNGRPGGPPNSLSNPNEQFGTTHFGLEANANIGPISISAAGQIILDRKGVHVQGSNLGGIIGIVKAEDKKGAKAKTKPISIDGGFFFAGTNAEDFDENEDNLADEYGGSLGPVSVRALASDKYEGFLVGMGIYGPNLQLGAGSGTLWNTIKNKVKSSVKSVFENSKSIE